MTCGEPSPGIGPLPAVLPSVPRQWQYLPAGKIFARHRHRVGHVSIVLSGGFDEIGDRGRLDVQPGDVLFRSPFCSHSQTIHRPTRIFTLALPFGFPAPFEHGCLDDPDAFVRLWERDAREAWNMLFERVSAANHEPADWRDRLARSMRAGGSVQSWAGANRMHPGGVARAFKQLYGTTAARYRNEQRGFRAWHEIVTCEKPLASIAYDLGFSDQAHMSREIRELSGLSPTQWRRLKKFNTWHGSFCHPAVMNRRQFNTGALAGACLLLSACKRNIAAPAATRSALPARTTWSVIESEGYDALCFWAPLAGDPESSREYADEVRAFLPRFDPKALQTIKALYEQTAAAGNVLTHSACRVFSAGPHSSIDDLIHSARNVDAVLKPAHLADPEWEGEELWERYRQLMPLAVMILEAMKAAGFQEFRRNLYDDKYPNRTQQLLGVLSPYNVAAEAQFLTGRRFEPNVEVALTYFSYPRGMRMLGQQFVTWAGYRDDTILNTSAHELMHPPLDLRGPAMQAAISKIFSNGFYVGVVTLRDPSLGDVGDVPNYVEECMVQALDQLASERRGSPRTAVQFLSRNNGADVLAACIYGLLKQDNYGRTGGSFEQWVARAVEAGRFDPPSLEAAGTSVLHASPISVWKPYRRAEQLPPAKTSTS